MAKKTAKKPAQAGQSRIARRVIVSARFDAAQTTEDNRRHRANADGLSPNAAITPEVRRKLREYARYEVANNSYAKGIGLTVANDTVGVGPTLQLLIEDKEQAAEVETLVYDWLQEINIAAKLRQIRFARYDTGEAFAVWGTNPKLRSPAKLDCTIFESEQFADPAPTQQTWNEAADGIQYDDFGNPRTYRKLKTHPGSMTWTLTPNDYDDIPAEFVFHYFRADRPGQLRGYPEITPAIEDFADVRKFTKASIAAAETAAEHAVMIESDAPVDPDASEEQEGLGPKTWDLVEIQRRSGVILPAGTRMNQLKAEHPINTYKEFITAKLAEIARCLCVPLHIAAMDASLANMSSSYVVGQIYTKERLLDRADLEQLLDMGLRMFLRELQLMGAIAPLPPNVPHQWNWPSLSHHADPQKVANAADTELSCGMTTFAIEYAKKGLDAAEQLQAQADLLGVPLAEYRKRLMDKLFGPEPAPPPEENPEEEDTDMMKTNQNQNGNGNGSRVRMRATATPNPKDVVVDLRGEATITLDAGEAKGPPKFEMLAYAGGAFRPHTSIPLPHPIVVDLAGMDLTKQSRPALKDHDFKQLVGHTVSIKQDGKQLTASGIISGAGSAAEEVKAAAGNGFVWPVSIGAELQSIEFVKSGQTVHVNGRPAPGPVFIARKSRLREISFLAMAADDDAVATIAAEAAEHGEVMDFATWLKANGFQTEAELNASQLTMLKAAFARSKGIVLEAAEKSIVETMISAVATQKQDTGHKSGDLDSVLNAEREKEKQRKQIVDLTAKALQDYPGQLAIIEALSQQAVQGDWDAKRYELELLRATRPQATGYRRVSSADEGLNDAVIEAALCLTGGITNPEKHFSEQTLDAAAKRWKRGIGLCEAMMIFAKRGSGNGEISVRDTRAFLKAAFTEPASLSIMAAPSTLSLPGILSNVANKFLRLGFDAVESTWRAIASIRSAKDFKEMTSYTLSGDFKYRKVAPGGQLEHAEVGEESYTNQVDTYGRMFAIDRRDIVNDDLSALTQVPRKLGRGAALKFNEVFWTEFLADHTSGGPGSGFFPVNNSLLNYISGATPGTNDSRMNPEGLTRGETQFLNQTDPNGHPLGIMPKILLVPNALNVAASELVRSVELRDTTASTNYPTGNPHAGKFTVVRSSYLSNSAMGGAYSTAFWYLLADPNELSFIEAAFLNGIEVPQVESADADFNQLGIQMRGVHDFGVNKQEYRAALKSKGAA